ncbi:MAG: hypothetical protein WCF17_22630 [Terracidiphilus sp.]
MKMRSIFVAALIFAGVLLAGAAQAADDRPVQSPHIAGPHGLEGWTLNWPLPDNQNAGERYPSTLVIARNGKVLRKIEGGGFVWNWIFWDDGRKVAYESGPLHFGLACNLYDLAKGRDVASFDCFHGIPDNAPAWLQALESSPRQ